MNGWMDGWTDRHDFVVIGDPVGRLDSRLGVRPRMLNRIDPRTS